MLYKTRRLVEIECPYCGFINKVHPDYLESGTAHYQFMVCDIEEGGCDRQFGFKLFVTVRAETLKIEPTTSEIEESERQALVDSVFYGIAREYAEKHDIGLDEAIGIVEEAMALKGHYEALLEELDNRTLEAEVAFESYLEKFNGGTTARESESMADFIERKSK